MPAINMVNNCILYICLKLLDANVCMTTPLPHVIIEKQLGSCLKLRFIIVKQLPTTPRIPMESSQYHPSNPLIDQQARWSSPIPQPNRSLLTSPNGHIPLNITQFWMAPIYPQKLFCMFLILIYLVIATQHLLFTNQLD